MKNSTVMGNWTGRIARVVLGLGLLALFSGCIARREALNANTTSVSLSQAAVLNLTKLKESQDAEVKAHLATRESCRKLFADWRKARLDAARNQINSDYQGKLAEIDQEASALLAGLREFRFDAHTKLEGEIDRAAKPLEDKLRIAEKARAEARSQMGQFPGDKIRQEAFEKANDHVLGTYIVTLTNQFKSLVRAVAELDVTDKAAVLHIQALAQQHRDKVQARYNKALGELPADSDSLPDFGPDPAVNEAVFAGLIKYAEAVQKAAEGNRDFLISNSFGSGSFFSDFLKSLGKGVLGGVFNPASVKGIDAEVLKASFKDVAGTVAAEFKTEANEASATFKKEGGSFLDGVKKGVSEKLSTGINTAFNHLLK